MNMPAKFFLSQRILKELALSAIGLMGRVFSNGAADQDSIPGRVIPKTQKMVLDAALLSTQHYKVRNKGKVGAIQGKE